MKDILENNQKYLERKIKYKEFGYDIDYERNFIIENSQPFFGDILEVGTGKGYLTMALAKKGYRITTVDISDEEQEFAKLNINYHKLEDRVVFKTDDAEKLSFKDNSFNIVLSVNTMHHLNSPFLAVDEFIRVVDSEGKVIISDFSQDGFELIEKLHQSECKTHNRNQVMMQDIEEYILRKGFNVKKNRTKYQDILIINFYNNLIPYDYLCC